MLGVIGSGFIICLLLSVKCAADLIYGQLASCLIYAKPFRHPFRVNPAPILVLVWVRSFIELDVLKTKVPFENTTQIYLINLHWKLGLGFNLRLRVALF